jgi:hypothetical protein
MAADATLVNASFKEAEANVKQFDPNVAKLNAGLVSQVIDPITKVFDQRKLDKEAKELELKEKNKKHNDAIDAQLAKFTDEMDAVNLELSTYEKGGNEGAMHSSIFNVSFDDHVELQKEYELVNTIGDDDTPANKKKRMEIMGGLVSRKNQIVKLRGVVSGIAKLAGSGDGGSQTSSEFAKMNPDDLYVVNSIANMDEDKGYENVVPKWEGGMLMFDVTMQDGTTVKTIKASELEALHVTIPAALEEGLLNIDKTNIETSQGSDISKDSYSLTDGYDAYMGIMKKQDPNANSHIYTTRQESEPINGYLNIPGGTTGKWQAGSWANALEANVELNGTYNVDPKDKKSGTFDYNLTAGARNEIIDDLIEADNEINMSDVDTDTTPGISDAEYEAFMGGKNRDLAIDVLVNSKNPLHDAKVSAHEYSLFRASRDEAKYNANQPEAEGEKTDWLNEKRRIDFLTAKAALDKEEAAVPIDYANFVDGKYTPLPKIADAKEGSNYKNPADGKTYQVVKENGKLSYVDITDQLETTTTISAEAMEKFNNK